MKRDRWMKSAGKARMDVAKLLAVRTAIDSYVAAESARKAAYDAYRQRARGSKTPTKSAENMQLEAAVHERETKAAALVAALSVIHIKVERGSTTLRAERRTLAAKLREHGKSDVDIASELGVSRYAVSLLFKGPLRPLSKGEPLLPGERRRLAADEEHE